jgi:hypothetical protein
VEEWTVVRKRAFGTRARYLVTPDCYGQLQSQDSGNYARKKRDSGKLPKKNYLDGYFWLSIIANLVLAISLLS